LREFTLNYLLLPEAGKLNYLLLPEAGKLNYSLLPEAGKLNYSLSTCLSLQLQYRQQPNQCRKDARHCCQLSCTEASVGFVLFRHNDLTAWLNGWIKPDEQEFACASVDAVAILYIRPAKGSILLHSSRR
jgi:hypothetical protein